MGFLGKMRRDLLSHALVVELHSDKQSLKRLNNNMGTKNYSKEKK